MEDLNLGGTNHVDAQGTAADFAALTSPMEQFAQPLDSIEAERTKKVGKCNLRKSLAWDAAFFTSAGVLDPDELSCMIDGGSSIKREVLPGIEEDIHRSTDSLSSLGSENLTLESLEIDLFEDIRASIQKSSNASNRAKSIKATSGDAGTQDIISLKDDLVSKSVANLSAGPKKQTSRMQTPGKVNSPKGTHSVAGTGDSTPFLQKVTKANGRPVPGPSTAVGKSSLRSNQVRLENDKAKGTTSIAKMAPVPKVPGFTGSKRIVPKPVIPSKSSSSSSSTATNKEPHKISYSSDSSTSTASASSNPIRIASRSVNPISTNSILKPQSKVASKKKIENGLSSSRSSKLSSSISPASSISEWSVTSSSSTSSVNQCSNTVRATIGAGCPRKPHDNTAPLNNVRKSTHRGLDRHESKISRPNSGKPNAASAQRGPPLKPATAKPSGLRIPLPNSETANAASAQRGPPPKAEASKPSGLRMPSPKIGFFDGVKPVVHTPSGISQSRSGIPCSPKVGTAVSTPTELSSKAKSPRLQPTRLAKPIGNIKLDTRKSVSPVTSKKVSNASTKVHSSPKNAETPLKLSPLTQNGTDEEKFTKTKETRVKEISDANGKETEIICLVDVDKEISANLVDLKIVPVDGDIYDCKGKVASGEKTNGVYITEKNSTADFKSGVDLDEQMSANSVQSKIVPADGDTYDFEGKMALEDKCNDLHSICKNSSPADLNCVLILEQKLNSNLVNLKIDPVDGEIYDREGEMASGDATLITEKINPVDLKKDLNLAVEMSANSRDMEIVPVVGETYDCKSKMSSEEENDDVISITAKITLADVKNDVNLDLIMNSNTGIMEVFPADGEVYNCEGKLASEEKNNDVTFITEITSPADVNKDMNLDVNMSANSGNVKIGPVDGEIYDSDGKLASGEKSNDVRSSSEKIGLADLNSNMNMEVNMSLAASGNMEIALVDRDIYDCERKIGFEEKSSNAVCISDKTIQDLESEMNSEVKIVYLVNQKIVPVDGDIDENMACEEQNNHVKLITDKIDSGHVNFEMNLEGKDGANSVNVMIAPLDGDIYEKETVCQENKDDGKSEIQRLINNWNSLHKSAEKANQIKGLSLDVGHGHSEHDLQKENGTSFSSPKNLVQTEELLSNMSKISQLSETIASSRTPFTDKNSSSNDERSDLLTEFIVEGMDKVTLLPTLECPLAEN